MAGDTNETENLWRWLSHSEDSIFLLDGLTSLKDLLVPTQAEMPPSESFDGCHKSGREDISRLVKMIKGNITLSDPGKGRITLVYYSHTH